MIRGVLCNRSTMPSVCSPSSTCSITICLTGVPLQQKCRSLAVPWRSVATFTAYTAPHARLLHQPSCRNPSIALQSRQISGLVVLCAQQQKQPQKKPSPGLSGPQKTSKTQRRQLGDVEEVENELSNWRFFDAAAYNQGWEVPWGGGTIGLGMFLWATTFILVGLLVVPLLGFELGFKDFGGLTQTDKATYALINQVAETVVGLGAIALVTAKSRPLPDDLFRFDLRNPFRKGDGWLAWGVLGVAWAPVVVGLTAVAAAAVGYDSLGGKGTVDGVAQIISLDGPTYFSLLSVTAVLAPVLEESVFRGFLLTSLTKYMPTWAAVLVSSGFFGAAHLSVRDLPQLVALGVILGFSYVRSRNLATPMLIHAMWNGSVLTILFLLVSSGIDVTDFV